MRRIVLIFASLCAAPLAHAQTPGIVVHCDESMTWGQTTSGSNVSKLVTVCPGATSGDIAVVNVMVGESSEPSGLAVTDDASGGSNSYSLVNSQADSTEGNWLGQFCGVLSHTGGNVYSVAATTDLGSSFAKMSVSIYYNANCTVLQTWGQRHAASTTWSCGSATKSVGSGALIHTFMFESFATLTKESSFAASSGFQLLDGSGQIWDTMPQSWGAVSSGSYNPSVTVSSSAAYTAACVALTATTAGSAPSATTPYMRAFQHGAVACIGSLGPCNESGSTIAWPFPTSVSGSLIVILFTGGNTDYATAISSSVSGETVHITGSCAPVQNTDGAAGSTQIAYILNAAASQSRILTFTPDATPIANDTYNIMEIANMSSAICDTGGQETGTQNTDGAAITYSVGSFGESNPVVVSVLSVDNGGVATSAPSSGVNFLHGSYFANVSGTGEIQCPMNLTPPNMIDECNGFYNSFPASSSSFNITANIDLSSEAFGAYAYGWAAFNPNTGGGGTTTAPPLLHILGTGIGD